MAFQIKDFASIAASCINWMRSVTTKVTDFNVGSVVRTMIEAVAAEIEELYQMMFIGLREAIPVSVYNSFDFARLESIPASGLVRVTVTSSAEDVVIVAGATMSPVGSSVVYTVTQDKTIAAGDTFVDVPVAASVAGAVGNVPASTAFVVSPVPANFVSATNQANIINGLDQETDDQRKLRFNEFIASLNRGTGRAIEYGLKEKTAILDVLGNETERVVYVAIVEPYLDDPGEPVGLVNVYIHNGTGSTSGALVTRAREVVYGYVGSDGVKVPGWKAAGVNVEIYTATEQALDVTAALTAKAGYVEADLIAEAEDVVNNYLLGLDIGASAIRSEIIGLVMEIDGVYNFIPSAPTGDTSADVDVKIMPGTITIT